MIKISGLTFEYPGKRALDNISLSVAEGSVTALVGPNGAGKTTLLRCIAGLEIPLSGTIRVADTDVVEKPHEVHRMMGYLSDFFGLYQDLTVEQRSAPRCIRLKNKYCAITCRTVSPMLSPPAIWWNSGIRSMSLSRRSDG